MFRATSIARLPGFLDIRSGIRSLSYTRPVSACANCFRGCRASAREGIARQRAARSSLPPVTSPQGNLREARNRTRSEEHTSELQSHSDIVCRLLLEKKKKVD